MVTSFSAQLARIAAESTHELDVRARRALHAESLIFPRETAISQDFDTIYTLCFEGFRELCRLDARFHEFEKNLFSLQAKEQDREQMTRAENEALDAVIHRLLHLLAGKILLNPGVKVLEWLVRRFRVHVQNTAAVLLTVLPFHDNPIWRNVLSIIPINKLVADWKWVAPYHKDTLSVPRHTIVYALTNNDGFWRKLNSYVIETATEGFIHPALLQFWSCIVVEAIIGRLSMAKSGRKEVQQQRMEDTLLKILPLLSDGFEVKNNPELTLALFAMVMVLAAKADLEDRVLDTLLQTVASTMEQDSAAFESAIITMNVIINKKQHRTMPRAVVDGFRRTPNLETKLNAVGTSHSVTGLLEGLINGITSSVGSKKRNASERIIFLERLLTYSSTLIDHTIFKRSIQRVLLKALETRTEGSSESVTQNLLVGVIQRLNQDAKCSQLLAEAITDLGAETERAEALLGETLYMIEAPLPVSDAMDVDVMPSSMPDFGHLLTNIPARTADTSSFLAHYDQQLFDQLAKCFVSCCGNDEAMGRFVSLPIWSSATSGELLLITFLLRISFCPYKPGCQAIAINLIAHRVQKLRNYDLQLVLPYALTAMSASSITLRKASSELIVAMATTTASSDTTEGIGAEAMLSDEEIKHLFWMSPIQFNGLLHQALLPILEECVLDGAGMARAVESALSGQTHSATGSNVSQLELKKGVRHDFLQMLSSHAVATSSWVVKVTLIQMLTNVHKVGVSIKSNLMAPIFSEWLSFSDQEAESLLASERFTLHDVDTAIAGLISYTDKDGVERVLATLQDRSGSIRPKFVSAVFNQIRNIWRLLKDDTQTTAALTLFHVSFLGDFEIAGGAQSTLQSVSLSTNQLGAILESSMTDLSEVQVEGHPKKRRRTSRGQETLPPDLVGIVKSSISRLTFALELIHASNPEKRPELIAILLDALALLKRLKQQHHESPYLVNLDLAIILSIIGGQQPLPKPLIEISLARADLIIDCIRSSESPQVQNTALLLSASLASAAPDQMLHNVMPIFTFMGQNMHAREDEHSKNVVTRAVDQIVPALVDSLRKHNKDMIKSTAGLLSSFAAAYDHMPQDRRISVYRQLLSRMGAEDFAFALVAMLAARKSRNSVFTEFIRNLMSDFSVHLQIITYQKLIDLANDVMDEELKIARDVFDLGPSITKVEHEHYYLLASNAALDVLGVKSLASRIQRLHLMPLETQEIWKQDIGNSIRETLSTIKTRKALGHDFEAAKLCLDSLLSLPTLAILLNLTPSILAQTEDDQDLKPQALRVLVTKLEGSPPKDSKTRIAALELASILTRMLNQDASPALKQAIIICIDRLVEAYGRKDIGTVVAAMAAVAGNECVGSSDRRVVILSLLCLASMIEVVREACAPLVPKIVARTVNIVKETCLNKNEELYTASNTLLVSITSHVAFLISETDLGELLLALSNSTNIFNSTASTNARTETIQSIARSVDLSIVLDALHVLSLDSQGKGPNHATLSMLDLLSLAIVSAKKAIVSKETDSISRLLLINLGTPWIVFEDEEHSSLAQRLEAKVYDVAIQYIYKLNDTAFRPVFESWIDWAFNAYDVSSQPDFDAIKIARQTSLFGLLAHFFDTLKSIVTSYFSSIIIPAASILNETISSMENNKKVALSKPQIEHYTRLFKLLQTVFAHDADGFFAMPSHFDPLGPSLIKQLGLVSSKGLRGLVSTQIIPAIVSLATATIDTPKNHQALSHHLTVLRHSDSAAVRLSSIQALAALSSDEDVGDEFIANTIGVGSAAITDGDGAGIARGGGSSAGEMMIYVNEMLEDDDENVEIEVRKWVQNIREKVGENVFET